MPSLSFVDRKGWWRWSSALLSLVVLVALGCQQRPATPVVKAPEVVGEQRDASLQLAVELLHQASEFTQFNAALNQINGPLAKQAGAVPTLLDDKTRQLVNDLFQPDAAELEDLEAGLTRPLDAAYLQSCFLFRDAARSLEVNGLAPLDQAALGFAWTMRRVLLHEQQDDGLPPHLVLQRGYGSVRDRALVALELLRQWQIDGCLVVFPKKEGGEALLVGIVLPKKDGVDVALFDPRLGLPVTGPLGIATLADVRAKPEWLQASGIGPEQLKQANARPASSLAALAPRMKVLQDLLGNQEPVILYHDVAGWQRGLSGADLPPATWPSQDKQAPARRLRLFYGKEEGGVDAEQRLIRFTLGNILQPAVLYNYEQMKVLKNLQPAEAQDMLTKVITANLFQRYFVEPRMVLLRGRHDDAMKRADRMSSVIENAASAVPIPDAEFNQQIAQWRDRVKEAYRAGEARGKQIWLEDQYLWALIQPDDAVNPQKFVDRKTMLSHIVLRACREPLGNRADAVKAACWEDKAAKLEAQAEARRQAGKQGGGNQDAVSAWKNARSAWAVFLDRGDLTPAQLGNRVKGASELARQGQRELALSVLEQLHLDLRNALAGRLRLAEANLRLGQPKLAGPAFTKLRADLMVFEKSEQPRKFMQDFLDLARTQPALAHQAKRFEMLLRDWTPDGHLAALRQHVERHLETLK